MPTDQNAASPRVVETVAAMRAAAPRGTRAVVMTMGALHDGHATLIDVARERAGADGEVVVSIFVNPTQFGPGEDYQRYPRTWEQDLELCSAHGVDLVFAPTADDFYGAGTDVTVDPGPLGDVFEGAVRPGHFRGVLTVVLKLINVMAPTHSVFGEKDFQQLSLIRRMVAQFDVPTQVVGVPTVREPDGLARSSRNVYLSDSERATAAIIPRATAAAVAAAEGGASAADVIAAAESVLSSMSGVAVDYVDLVAPDFGPLPPSGPARLIVAARIGPPRLLDNVAVTLEPR
ncbi:MAG: pantoate--beta-alanine ligase [Candidatus Nanopelagicales bacterium]